MTTVAEKTETNSRLAWALAFAARGWPVIRLDPGSKRPVSGLAWSLDMTTDAEVIRRWYKANPDINYGVCGGGRRVIIDLDRKPDRNGLDQWEKLEVLLDGALPETLTVSTRTGGRHIYMTLPEGVEEVGQSARKIAKVLDVPLRDLAIDIRAAGGYVVGPGCEVTLEPGERGPGVYERKAGSLEEIAEAPEWLLPLFAPPAYQDPEFCVPVIPLDQPTNVARALAFLEEREPAIQGRHGNDHTYETVAFVRDFGVSEELAPFVVETSGWNGHCSPPWSDSELKALIRHVYSYSQNRAGSKGSAILRLYETEEEPLDVRTFDAFLEARAEERDYLAEALRDIRENPHLVAVEHAPEWFKPVAELNRRFAILDGGDNEGRLVDLQDPRKPVLLNPERFRLLLKPYKAFKPTEEGPVPVPIATAWENWPGRRVISGLEFRPPGGPEPSPGAHNLWRGFAVEPKPGLAHKPLLRHILDNVCRGDKELAKWFVSWLADMAQNPGRKPAVAVALVGEPGAGKTVIYEYMKAIFGDHALAVDSPRLVTGNFNSHMAGRVLLGIEEGFWAGSKESESKLKSLITSKSLVVEQKGVDGYEIDNAMRLLVTSNESWVIPVSARERRWAVLEVDPREKDNREYWSPIFEALEDETGPANLLHYLLNRPLDPALLFRPPMTRAKARQAQESMDNIAAWWLAVLQGDRSPTITPAGASSEGREDGIFGADTAKEAIYRDYMDSCDRGRLGKPYAPHVFWTRFKELAPAGMREFRPHGQSRMIWFPDREVCQGAMAERYGVGWSELGA